MKHFKSIKIVCLCLLTVYSCSKDDDQSVPVDPRLEFVGSYRISETVAQYSDNEGTQPEVSIDLNPRINFEIDNSLNNDELLVDMEEFIEDLYRGLYLDIDVVLGVIDVDIDDDIIAQISGNDFEINNAEFEVTIALSEEEEHFVLDNEMDVEGDFNGNALRFDFEIYFSSVAGQAVMEGDSEGDKD
ncbi:hypothetical protein ACFS5M_03645 [Lacinutrix iliipiscaria]|uniref:Lipid/polyisoprenoid-binding YceI-like domain-containing protein n=1 Tax=Lacinutrix iliipiscaria TaxID=1230532 RepID=A0ABW5WJ67_9FLAO